MTGHARSWGFALLAGLATSSCASAGSDSITEPVPVAAASPAPTAPAPAELDAGTVQATVPPASTTPAAGSAAPSSKPDAGPAAPSSKPQPTPAAGSGAPPAPATVDPTKGIGGSTQSDGKLSAFIDLAEIPSGAEEHRCVLVELPNSEPVWVSALHASLGNGSHHMIIDRRRAQDELLLDAEQCSPTMGGDASRLMIAQQHETTLDLPQGVGFLLEPKQRIFLQLHYINTSDKPFAIKGTIEFKLFANDVRPIEAKSIFTGSTSITLPPHQPGESKHFQVLPADPAWNVFAMTSHTHQLGVHSTIERVLSATAPTITPLHESRDWSEPPLTVFAQPLVFDGSDGLRLICRYMNTTDRDVHFGTAVDDEMCFMWVYYFENGQR